MEILGDILAFIFFAGALVFLGFGLFGIISDNQSKNDYSYIDMDSKTGFADYCARDRGQLYCRIGDRTIQVKEYAKIKEEK